MKDEEAAQLLSEGEAEVVQGQSRSERQRHRSMCMHAPSSSFVAMLQQISFNSKGPAIASPRPRPRSAVSPPTLQAPAHAYLVEVSAVSSRLQALRSADLCWAAEACSG